ncbi:MAG TPA: MFS transporter [Variovorax sp.]
MLLGACAFSSMASMRVCDALLPALATEFGTTVGRAAQAVSFFALAYGLAQLFYGPLGDRFGKLRVIGLATLACTAGNAAAAFSTDMASLVASRVLSGLAAAGVVPLTMAWIGDNVPYAHRQEVLARLLGATVFGMISGQWLGGLIAQAAGWHAAFAVLALLFLVCGVLLVAQSNRYEGPMTCVPSGGFAGRMRSVLMQPWARVVLVVTGIEGAFVFGAVAFIPSYLHGRFGLSMPTAGAVVALYGVGGLVYSRCGRGLVRRLGEAGLARLGGCCLATAFAVIAVSPAWPPLLPACLLAGFGFYALHNTLQTHATQMAPGSRGTAVSLFACTLFLGQSLGVLAAAWSLDRFSASLVFVLSSVAVLTLGFVFAAAASRQALLLKDA